MFHSYKTRSLKDLYVLEQDSFVFLPWKGGKSMAESPGFHLFRVPQTSQEHQNVIFELLTHCGQKCGFEQTQAYKREAITELAIYNLKRPKRTQRYMNLPFFQGWWYRFNFNIRPAWQSQYLLDELFISLLYPSLCTSCCLTLILQLISDFLS